nr:hypothetical protein [Tanacetum cinerariifolium]
VGLQALDKFQRAVAQAVAVAGRVVHLVQAHDHHVGIAEAGLDAAERGIGRVAVGHRVHGAGLVLIKNGSIRPLSLRADGDGCNAQGIKPLEGEELVVVFHHRYSVLEYRLRQHSPLGQVEAVAHRGYFNGLVLVEARPVLGPQYLFHPRIEVGLVEVAAVHRLPDA